MSSFFKEPLVLFLLLGSTFFFVFNKINSNLTTSDQQTEITITQGRINSLVQGFSKVWQRRPSQKEIDGLIQNFIKEEIFYREALSMGLDKEDAIVRRRLSQKMEFITEDIVMMSPATDQELTKYLKDNEENYRSADQYSFTQIFIDPNKHQDSIEVVSQSLINQLNQPEVNITDIGDPLMINNEFTNVTSNEITRQLGKEFLQALSKIDTDSWQGPVRSGFGYHLVFIKEHLPGKIPNFEQVRITIERDWQVLKRKQVNDSFYKSLRAQYQVSIEDVESSNNSIASKAAISSQ